MQKKKEIKDITIKKEWNTNKMINMYENIDKIQKRNKGITINKRFNGYPKDMIEKRNKDKLKENKRLGKHPKGKDNTDTKDDQRNGGSNLRETKGTITSTTMTCTKKVIHKKKRS